MGLIVVKIGLWRRGVRPINATWGSGFEGAGLDSEAADLLAQCYWTDSQEGRRLSLITTGRGQRLLDKTALEGRNFIGKAQ